jgi:hypothetical protein
MIPFKKIGITIAGVTLILVGIALLVLPGPGIVVIISGLAVLGTEYHAARRLIQPLKDRLARLKAEQQAKATAKTAKKEKDR